MRFLVRAVMAASLIAGDAAQTVALSAPYGDRVLVSSLDRDYETRFKRSEASWKRIAGSICVGCSTRPAPLEIVRKLPEITRLERQAGIGVPLADPAPSPSATVSADPVAASGAEAARPEAVARTAALEPEKVEPKPETRVDTAPEAARVEQRKSEAAGTGIVGTGTKAVTRKRTARAERRHVRQALRTRKQIRYARLRRIREQRRLALLARSRRESRRLDARPALHLTQTPPVRTPEAPDASGAPDIRSGPKRIQRVSVLMPADRPRPASPQQRNPVCLNERDAALTERSRSVACASDR